MTDNAQIPQSALPHASEVDWQSLSPRYLHKSLLAEAIRLAVISIAVPTAHLFITGSFGLPWWGWLLLIGYAVTEVVVTPTAIRRAGYALREDDLQYRRGLLVHRRTAAPFRRVQHVETTRGILDRAFGLTTLKLYTAAGGAGADLSIPGLDLATADRLQAFILGRVDDEAASNE